MLKKYKKFQNVLLGLNALVLIILILVPMFNLIFMNSFEDMVVIWAVVTIIFLEIVIMVVQNAYENKVDKATYGKKSQEFVQEIKPIVKSEIEYAREELRHGLTILLTVMVITYIAIYVMVGRIYLIIGLGLLMVIVYIYADYLPHAKRYAEKYDGYFNNKPRKIMGLARIYCDEYKETKFNRKSEYYTRLKNESIYVKNKDNPQYAKDYIKCVLWQTIEHLNNTYTMFSYVLIVINIMTLWPRFYEDLFMNIVIDTPFMEFIYLAVNMVATVFFAVMNIHQLQKYEDKQKDIKQLFELMRLENVEEMVRSYEQLDEGYRKELFRIKGAFMFSSKIMDEKKSISGVPIKYRMLFIHKYIANIPRMNNSFLLATCVSILLLVDMFGWRWEWTTCIIGSLLIYIFVRFIIIKNLGKHRIGRACKKLLECERTNTSIEA